MYLSKATSDALDELLGACFDMNRSIDRMVSWMLNVWCMPQASDIIHHKLAHLWPLIGDEVSSFKDQYNVVSYYPPTHGDKREYTNLLDMMETMLKETGEVYEMTKMVYKVAQENEDFNACAMLIKFMDIITTVMGQTITLRDKAKEMPTDFDTYDKHIEVWGINGVDLS